jgi:histidinol-phosphate aminotransferase
LNSNGNIAFLRKDKLYQNIKDVDAFCFVNPNQISNNDISLNELDSLCKNYPDKKFLIDEAYYGFGHYTAIPLTRKHNNIFVTRSFSKTFGLASLRVGALIASEDSIKPFKTLATTYASNVFSSQSCIFFLDNINCVRYYNDLTVLGRDWFVNELRKSEYKVVSPKSISIMIYCDSQKEQQRILQESKEKEFYFKGITTNSKHHFIRVTCGPEKIMQQIYKKCFKND